MLVYLAYKCTVFAEIKSVFLERSTVAKNLNSVCEVSVFSEIICLAVNFMKRHISRVACHIITRTIIIACAFVIRMPCAVSHTFFVEDVCYAVKRILTRYCSTCPTEEVVPFLTDLYPAAGERTKF